MEHRAGVFADAYADQYRCQHLKTQPDFEQFIAEFADSCSRMTGEQAAHSILTRSSRLHGLYLYRVVYNLGTMNLSISASWFASATLIILALPLGLIFARIMTDKMFRYCT